MSLPTPACRLGYTYSQLETILGERTDVFGRWMRGQTMDICDGRHYNHILDTYEASGCGPHGVVVYPCDLQRFLAGQPITD